MGWVISTACLVYIGLIAVGMSGVHLGPLLDIPPVAQRVVTFPDSTPGPPGALELPPPATPRAPALAARRPTAKGAPASAARAPALAARRPTAKGAPASAARAAGATVRPRTSA